MGDIVFEDPDHYFSNNLRATELPSDSVCSSPGYSNDSDNSLKNSSNILKNSSALERSFLPAYETGTGSGLQSFEIEDSQNSSKKRLVFNIYIPGC